MVRIVSIHSARGGTGKSHIAANLAVAIALQGKRVAVLDTDLQTSGIQILFGLDEGRMGKTLNDYLWNRCAITDTAYDVSHLLQVRATLQGALFLVPCSTNPNAIVRILREGYDIAALKHGIHQLIADLNLDCLLIDTHPGLGKETFLALALSHLTMLILCPDHQDFQGTRMTIAVAAQLKVPKLMLILNQVLPQENFTNLREQIEKLYDVPVSGMFPHSEDIMQLGSREIFLLNSPTHPFSQEIEQVVTQIFL